MRPWLEKFCIFEFSSLCFRSYHALDFLFSVHVRALGRPNQVCFYCTGSAFRTGILNPAGLQWKWLKEQPLPKETHWKPFRRPGQLFLKLLLIEWEVCVSNKQQGGLKALHSTLTRLKGLCVCTGNYLTHLESFSKPKTDPGLFLQVISKLYNEQQPESRNKNVSTGEHRKKKIDESVSPKDRHYWILSKPYLFQIKSPQGNHLCLPQQS